MFMKIIFAILITECVLLFLLLLPLPQKILKIFSNLLSKFTSTTVGYYLYMFIMGLIIIFAVVSFYQASRMETSLSSETNHMDFDTINEIRKREFFYQRNGYINAFCGFYSVILSMVLMQVNRFYDQTEKLKKTN
eukprot:TRINITY_DN294_c1_g1_i1.p1 TRINITY_DN294_c1_g1~~TRINITY_DN294_c1_g1_i1.p1  ORF type:complete len:135 (-),score=19.23 TRINITY_DN294_c1_g1_i1:125-529(-)